MKSPLFFPDFPLKLIARWRRDERGVSAVEFAMIAPVMLTLMVGLLDYAIAEFYKMELSSATRAGAQYALVKGEVVSADIETVVKNATNLTEANGLTVTVSELCSCSGGDPETDPTDCAGSCASGDLRHFADIDATYDYSWIFLPFDATTLTAQSFIRVE